VSQADFATHYITTNRGDSRFVFDDAEVQEAIDQYAQLPRVRVIRVWKKEHTIDVTQKALPPKPTAELPWDHPIMKGHASQATTKEEREAELDKYQKEMEARFGKLLEEGSDLRDTGMLGIPEEDLDR